jgi:hypothetical protein
VSPNVVSVPSLVIQGSSLTATTEPREGGYASRPQGAADGLPTLAHAPPVATDESLGNQRSPHWSEGAADDRARP